MAKFTDFEEELLEFVTDDHLHLSLATIRQAAEDIWATDGPRIIQDHTDHGIMHSERLARFAASLLEANAGRPLSAQQIYLLLAGVYIHDVGMQCDVVRFPEIKTRAEALGAEFHLEFTAQTTGGYSIDEQKAIRSNHQYLAAAWIDHAYRTGETALGPAAKTIPSVLVTDLMHVCIYHARLPITDCPLMLRWYPTQHKQLVAALLRFADELDVDGHRANIGTVMNFRLDPSNAVYWWLHNSTTVVFSPPNVVLLTVRLHPDDAKEHGSYIQNAFITEFQRKNRPVLDVLRQNDIQIAINADSQVAEDVYADPLPPEIADALRHLQEDPNLYRLKVHADREGGIDTGIHLKPNDRISVAATGAISFDSGHNFTNADGLFSTAKGQLLFHSQEVKPVAWPHSGAYRTDGGQLGIIGSLFGWIGEYSEDSAFLVGESVEVPVETEGHLYLSVNDAKGNYGDNEGEFEVTIQVFN